MRDLTKTYRPSDWDAIIGQDDLVKTLKREIETDSIGHAYLLCGPRGTGKTTTARVLASHIDAVVIEMDAASNNGVDNIRDLRQDVQYLPTDNKKYKVYLIDEIHMLSTAGQNAFLKVLEEPPAHVIFILATTDPQKLLTTIISRCQRFDLKRIPDKAIVQNLAFIAEKECIDIDSEALAYIAKSVDGGMRDAIKLLQKCSSLDEHIFVQTVVDALGSVNVEHLKQMTDLLLKKDIKNALIYFRDLISSGVDIKIFLADTIQYLTDLMSNSIINNNFEIQQYINLSNEFVELLYNMRNSTQLKTLTELKFIKMCRGSYTDNEVKKEQAKIENPPSEQKEQIVFASTPGVAIDPDLEKRIMDTLSNHEKKFTAIYMELDTLKYQKR